MWCPCHATLHSQWLRCGPQSLAPSLVMTRENVCRALQTKANTAHKQDMVELLWSSTLILVMRERGWIWIISFLRRDLAITSSSNRATLSDLNSSAKAQRLLIPRVSEREMQAEIGAKMIRKMGSLPHKRKPEKPSLFNLASQSL